MADGCRDGIGRETDGHKIRHPHLIKDIHGIVCHALQRYCSDRDRDRHRERQIDRLVI